VKDLLDGLDKDEQNLIKINSILSALGVDSSDTDTLIQYFVKTNKNNEQKLISEENVITALKAFVNDHQYRVKQGTAVNSKLFTSSHNTLANMEEMTSTEEKKKEKIERQLEKEFWERLANVIPPEKYQAWLVLEKELVKYNAVLTDRANLLAENNSIRKQNEELKMLLNQYLTSKVGWFFEIFN
jgi:dynein regulatory complex protein 1